MNKDQFFTSNGNHPKGMIPRYICGVNRRLHRHMGLVYESSEVYTKG